MTTKFASIFAALAFTVAAFGSASAQEPTLSLTEPGALSVRVAYGDIDLSRAEGVAEMSARIEKALKAVCGSSRGSANAVRTMVAKCRKKALTNAIADINAPLLTALYNPERMTHLASR